ncbi:orotidine-5'-phosphate decarboxylase [bacterium]|nr:orotidine-5'-phosphate decarboxylase [bacterium]
MPHNPFIIALDSNDPATVKSWVNSFAHEAGLVKLGLEFFTMHGIAGVQKLELPCGLFLDLKFHDIPNTVKGAIRSAMATGCEMLTIHASGGHSMCKAAAETAMEEADKRNTKAPLVLAVTLLTSLSQQEATQIGYGNIETQVLKLAELAIGAGIKGLVCSPLEIAPIRARFGHDVKLVVPGIRAQSGGDDQTRTLSAAEAVKAGADYLVVGRPVTQAQNPLEALKTLRHALS